jgi:phosphoribosyl-AMP cyclohydrolase
MRNRMGANMSADLDPGLTWLEALKWNAEGLVPAIAQDIRDGRVLMLAWMNRESLLQTARTGKAVYWSRSRQRLWQKGVESGHVQHVRAIRADCDGDALLLLVEQEGLACHTGRASCFFFERNGEHWQAVEPVLQDPGTIYASTHAERNTANE